jgi:fatty-acyl-CoA synthase
MHEATLRAHDWIANHALRRPDAPATVDLASGRHFTYAQCHDRIDRLAACFAETFGVGAGDRVAVLAHACTDVFEVQFACFRVGAIFVPLNWRLAAAELAAILADCTPKLLIHDQAFEGRAREVTGPGCSWRLAGLGPGGTLEEEAARCEPGGGARAHPRLGDVCTILYTSGTTGLPKGVMVTHAMNLFNAVNINDLALISSRSVALAVLPLFHSGGLNVFANPVFHVGGVVVVMGTFDAGEALRVIGDPTLGITHMFGVPANYQFMAQHRSFAETDLSRLRHLGVGGAPAALAVIEAWQRRGAAMTQGYGMTESGPIALYLDAEDAVSRVGSAGKPVTHVDLRLVDAAGNEVADGEVGEIWMRGPTITPGYWGNPKTTEAAFTDGWLRTGDAATRDAAGYYTIVDRWKDMYISGGENVYPAEVENALYQLPEVAEAAVIGVPSARWGEVGRAVVVLKEGAALGADDIVAHCGRMLARYKLPHDVAFTDALPRNATGKVHKPSLRARFGGPAPG